jgi:hypothetical protein
VGKEPACILELYKLKDGKEKEMVLPIIIVIMIISVPPFLNSYRILVCFYGSFPITVRKNSTRERK